MGCDAVHRGPEERLTPDRSGWRRKRRFLRAGKKIIGVLFVLAIGQVIGWGTVGLLAVVGRQVAGDLHMDISAVFAGNSIFYVVMGLWRSLSGKGIHAIWRPAADDRRDRYRCAGLCAAVACARPGARISRHGLSSVRPAAQRSPRPPTSCSTRSWAGMQGGRSAADAGDRACQQYFLADHLVSFGTRSAGAAPVWSMPGC